MRQIVKEMNEKGQLDQLTKKWELKQPDCKPVYRKGTPLSFGKLTTLFLEISLGVLLTLILLFAEKIYQRGTLFITLQCFSIVGCYVIL